MDPCTFLAGESRNLHSDWSRVRESPLQKEGARSWEASRGQLFGPEMRRRGEEPCAEGGRKVARAEPRTEAGARVTGVELLKVERNEAEV